MRITAIVGPTGSGKTSLAIELCQHLDAEIVNIDSMQIYRDIAIGTAKPTPEERARATFHGIDFWPLGPPLDAAKFAAMAHEWIADITARGKLPILCGGTGLYFRAITQGILEAPARDDAIRQSLRQQRDQNGIESLWKQLVACDPITAARIHKNDWVRIERALEVFILTQKPLGERQQQHQFRDHRYDLLCFATHYPRPKLYERIEKRLDIMWTSGLIEETQHMRDLHLPCDALPLKALGYAQAAMFLNGELSEADALALAKRQTRRFAKRQLTWFRAIEGCQWIDQPTSPAQVAELIAQITAFRNAS